MKPERLKRVEELYRSAQAKSRRERRAFLAAACEGDSELRREIESLLANAGDSLVDTSATTAPREGRRAGGARRKRYPSPPRKQSGSEASDPGCELLVTTPSGHTSSVGLHDRPISLGRAKANVISLPEDDGLSRHHLIVEKRGGRWYVRNLASRNGTFVNGARVRTSRRLERGDRITASCVMLTFSQPVDRDHSIHFESPEPQSHWDAESTSLEEVLSSVRSESQVGDLSEGPRVGALWAVARAGRELAVRRPLAELFQITLDLSLEAVGAERGVLLTLDDGDHLVVQASRGSELRISTRVRDRVLKDKTSLLVRDALRDQLANKSQTIVDQGVHSLVAVPLQTDDRVIGLIYLDSLDQRRAFTVDDLHLLTAMAHVAGTRIERERWELQRRALVTENVESLSRLAAALSHEFNTPLGTLRSTVDTLVRAAAKRGSAAPDEQERLKEIEADLQGSLDAALERMQLVISRIRRFTNLDRADVQEIDLNELLSDVVALLAEPEIEIRLTTTPLPPIRCHRQSLSASFSSLLQYAVEECRQTPTRGTVLVTTKPCKEGVEVRIENSGRGRLLEEPSRLFDPSFRVYEGRVSAGDWSLFTARQVVQNRGGEIDVTCTPGEGSTFVVTLPVK